MADTPHEAVAPPSVPGFWRLGWLLFMQPLTLHRLFAAWGLKDDSSLWQLRGRLRAGDPVARALAARLGGWLLLGILVSSVAIDGLATFVSGPPLSLLSALPGISMALGGMLGFVFGFAENVFAGVAASVASAAAGVAFSVAIGVYIGFVDVAFGVEMGGAFGVAFLLTLFRLPL